MMFMAAAREVTSPENMDWSSSIFLIRSARPVWFSRNGGSPATAVNISRATAVEGVCPSSPSQVRAHAADHELCHNSSAVVAFAFSAWRLASSRRRSSSAPRRVLISASWSMARCAASKSTSKLAASSQCTPASLRPASSLSRAAPASSSACRRSTSAVTRLRRASSAFSRSASQPTNRGSTISTGNEDAICPSAVAISASIELSSIVARSSRSDARSRFTTATAIASLVCRRRASSACLLDRASETRSSRRSTASNRSALSSSS